MNPYIHDCETHVFHAVLIQTCLNTKRFRLYHYVLVNMNIGQTYCGKTIKDNQSLEWKKIILLTHTLDFQSYHTECCTLDYILYYELQLTTALHWLTLLQHLLDQPLAAVLSLVRFILVILVLKSHIRYVIYFFNLNQS